MRFNYKLKNKVELLSPAGDFDCVKAAVQNGADAIYLGFSSFSARSAAHNFTLEELKTAIDYAHVRNVKVHLALNILIKNEEFSDALAIAEKAYEYGVDAIIVQDMGLAMALINHLPKLPIHASTQMTANNLSGVQTLGHLGFERIVLARELSLHEIEYICRSSDVEIETFIHGALCFSYSGQCLMSSMIGGRSANRGKCAQACRLPYELIENDKAIDKGYLLSPRDLCGLQFIPALIDAGVASFKIEGRLKSPEYVAIVTRVYRKYIDLYYSGEKFEIDPKDIDDLRQVFNRGNFSSGHLDKDANRDLIFKEKPNNMGIYIGNVANYNYNKGHISLNLNDENVAIGDSITFENEPTKYRISELMFQNKNIPFACNNELVTIGRVKGNINPGDKVFKISSKRLSDSARETFSGKEFKKIKLYCRVSVKTGEPVSVSITPHKIYENYKGVSVNITSNIIPEIAINQPLTDDKIISQFSKTNDTPFEFSNIDVDLDSGLCIPKISEINALRREALSKLQDLLILKFTRVPVSIKMKSFNDKPHNNQVKISVLLSQLGSDFDYMEMDEVDRVYIPLRCFRDVNNKKAISTITSRFDTYIYLPTVINLNYLNLLNSMMSSIISTYSIKGFVFSSIGEMDIIKKAISSEFDCISNYTLNAFNDYTVNELANRGVNTVTLSPELTRYDIQNIRSNVDKELIVYGNLKVMASKYCFLGNSNNCYPTCESKCQNRSNKYYLKDRMGLKFRIIPNSLQNISNIYNSKTLSITYDGLNIDYARIDILEEDIPRINEVIRTVRAGERFEGNEYTNGNMSRCV